MRHSSRVCDGAALEEVQGIFAMKEFSRASTAIESSDELPIAVLCSVTRALPLSLRPVLPGGEIVLEFHWLQRKFCNVARGREMLEPRFTQPASPGRHLMDAFDWFHTGSGLLRATAWQVLAGRLGDRNQRRQIAAANRSPAAGNQPAAHQRI